MTVTTLTNRIDYTGDGVVKLFAFNFLVYEDAHLEVYLDGVLTITGFIITLDIENSGGDVTFTTAPAVGVDIVIIRDVPLTQLIDYTAFGPFPAETHEKGLDLGVMRDQQTVEFNDRALRVPVEDPPVADVPNVAGRAGRVLGFDAQGDPVPGSLLSDIVTVLDDLLDVDTTTVPPSQNQILKFIGAQWVNGDLPSTLTFVGNFDPVTGVPALQDVGGGGGPGDHEAGATYVATDSGLYNFTTATPGSGLQVNVNDQVAWSEVNTNWVVLATGRTLASEVIYDNTSSGMLAENVQDAIDELEVGLGAVALPMLKSTPGTIGKGQLVYAVNWTTGIDVPITVEEADASDPLKMPAIGIAREAFSNTVPGRVVTEGMVFGDTGFATAGDQLYMSTTFVGEVQLFPPAPEDGVRQAVGLVHSSDNVSGAVEFDFTWHEDPMILGKLDIETTLSVGSEMSMKAIQGIILTNPNLRGVAVWHPSIDEYPNWIDHVAGPVSNFMVATVSGAAGSFTVNVYDLTVNPPVLIQTAARNITGQANNVSFLGGEVAISTENGGIYVYTFDKEDFRLDVTHTPSTSGGAIPSGVIDHVMLGYTSLPRNNSATGGRKPSIAFASGGHPGIVRDDGKIFASAIDLFCNRVAWVNNRIARSRTSNPDALFKSTAPEKISSSIDADWASSVISTAAGSSDNLRQFDGDVFDIAGSGKFSASVCANGLAVQRVSDLGQNTDILSGIGFIAGFEAYTGWMPIGCRGAWLTGLASGQGFADRTGYGNQLINNGSVPEQAAGTNTETLSHGPYTNTAYFSRVYDVNFDFGTDDIYFGGWFKTAPTASTEMLVMRKDPANTGAFFQAYITSGGILTAALGDGTNTVIITSLRTVDNNVWYHFWVTWDGVTKTLTLYFNALFESEGVDLAMGTISAGTAVLNIGRGVNNTNAALNTELAMIRIGGGPDANITEDEIQYMHETEKRMFEDDAKVTLQGVNGLGQTVAIDGFNDDVWVGQADSLSRWNGITMEEERLAATELWTDDDSNFVAAGGGGMALANPVEAYAEVPNLDVRDQLERVRVGAVPLRPHPDRVKAWGFVLEDGSLQGSFNVKSVDKIATGIYQVNFAVSFVLGEQTVVGSPVATSTDPTLIVNEVHHDWVTIRTKIGAADADRDFSFAAFGQLEIE